MGEQLPCQTYTFMKDLRATKKPEQRAEQQKEAEKSYITMYKSYCALEDNAQGELCTNVLLKNLRQVRGDCFSDGLDAGPKTMLHVKRFCVESTSTIYAA